MRSDAACESKETHILIEIKNTFDCVESKYIHSHSCTRQLLLFALATLFRGLPTFTRRTPTKIQRIVIGL